MQNLPQQAVVAVPAAYALRLARVVFLLHGLSGDFAHEVDQLVHTDELIGAEVEGLCEVRVHQARETFDAIVHVAETASLLAIPPDFDCRSDLRLGNLAADGGGRFLTASLVRAKGSVDVVETTDSSVQPVIIPVVLHKLFGE